MSGVIRGYWSKKKGGGNTPAEPFLSFSSFGSLGTGARKWSGGALASNGFIYCCPSNSSTVLKIDPSTDTISTFGSVGGSSDKWSGAILAPNGKIYCAPLLQSSILIIDPTTDTTSTVASSSNYISGVLAPNGCIYFIPWSGTSILKIDTATDTVSNFGSLSGSIKWWGAALAPNGKIYCAPSNSSTILEIDPSTDTVRTFGSLSGSTKYFGAVLGADDLVYFSHHSQTQFRQLNPNSDATAAVGTTFGSLIRGLGSAMDFESNIYSPPNNSTFLTWYNTSLNTGGNFDLSSYISTTDPLRGCCFSQNGDLYMIPSSASVIVRATGFPSLTASDYTMPVNLSADLASSNYNKLFNKSH